MEAYNMRQVELIQIEKIYVLNPRERNRRQYLEIVDNIERIGLKRPITISRREDQGDGYEFDLVCGQGRLEAYRILGRSEIPAIVVAAKQEDCLVMSLVENIARRQRPAIELMREIEVLHDRGYNDSQIAQKVGATSAWVGTLLGLLESGEERLVAAVEDGVIPITLAITISRSRDTDIQSVLADAYTKGIVKGRKVGVLRRLLEQRAQKGRRGPRFESGKKISKKITSEDLMRIYQKEVGKQQLLVRTADYTQRRLLFVIQALQVLLRDAGFMAVLRMEGLDTIPGPLERRMIKGGGGVL
jgi:ParB family transcriptional regulator, chromosome partitioning protein